MAQTILEIQLKGVKEAEASMQRLSLEIDNQKKKQAELRADNKKQEQSLKDKKISQEDYTQAVAQNNIEIEKSKKIQKESTLLLRQSIRVTNAEVGTLESKRSVLARLKNEYAKLNTETEDGARAEKIYREEIQKLTEDVKEQEKSIGDTRRNVGNYEDAIKDAVGSMIPFGGQLQEIAASGGGVKGALSMITTGIQGATRAAIAFIATPIGAAITALAAIGAATKAWFDYNNEIRKTNSLLAGITDQTGETLDNIRRQTAAIEESLGVSAEESAKAAKVLVQQFGISYEEALDKMQTGILATNGANDELLASISEYSTFFSDAGYSVDEFTGIVNAGFDLGIYTDKLPDALKEADISLREQTKATREALTNAFGKDFTSNILSQINAGALSTKDALELMSQEANKVGLSAEQAATLTADVFRGAGEDAGGALKVFEALSVGISGSANELDEYGEQLSSEIDRATERAKEMDAAFKSDNFIAFQEGMREIGHFIKVNFIKVIGFLTDGLRPIGDAFGRIAKAFGVTTKGSEGLSKAFQFLMKVGLLPLRAAMKVFELSTKAVAVVVEQARRAFDKLNSVAQSLSKPIKSIASALGMQSNETKKVTKATKEAQEAATGMVAQIIENAKAQALANKETEQAAIVLQEAKERADEYVSSLRDIVSEQARQPLLMEAEDLFSKESADDVTSMLNNVADQIEENENITRVSYKGMSLSVEEFTQLSKDRLNEIERAESRSSSRRSSRRNKEQEEALARIDALKEIVNAETERTLAEEDLIDKRFYDKLRELDLDKDISQMTADELAARTALYAKYNDDLAELRAKNQADAEATEKETFDKSLQLVKDKLATDLLIRETAMLNELRNQQLTEEQKLALQEQFQNESLELQREALVKQIELIESTLGDGETTAALEQLRKSLAGINLEIANAGKDPESGEPKTLADRLGLNEKQVKQINDGVAGVEAGLSAMSQLAQAQAAERMANVDQMLQQGVINEEEATRKKEQIQREAARKQQKIDTTQAVINTAKAVTSALNSQPFLPTALIMAGIAAAQGAAQIKMIRSQKFAKGGILNGPSHAQGGIPMFSKGGSFYGEAEGGEAVLTKGVMKNPALASMASAINVAGGGVPFFANGGVLDPIQSATPTDRAADIIASGMKSQQPVLVVEQLRERENSVDVIESLRTIG